MNQRLASTYAEELVRKVKESLNAKSDSGTKITWSANIEQYYQTNLNKVILSQAIARSWMTVKKVKKLKKQAEML